MGALLQNNDSNRLTKTHGIEYIYILRVDISAWIFAVWARAHTQGEVSQIPLRAAKRMIPGYKTVYSTCLIDVPRAARGQMTPGEMAIFRNVNFGS